MRRLLLIGLVVAAVVAGGGLAIDLAGTSLDGGAPTPSAASLQPSALSPGASGAAVISPSPAPSPSSSPTPAPTPTPTEPPLPVGALQAALETWRAKSATPGVSVTIRWADGRSWTGVAGLADAGRGTPMTAGTAFSLASITKTFVAALALQLVEEGRLALDQSVAPILAGLGLDPRITLRMLLDHTSGLPDIFMAPGIDRAVLAAPDRVWKLADSLAYTKAGRAVPGTRWTYSNTNYLLLGVLLERVTGESFAALVRTRLLEPLGLDSAYVQIAERARGPIATGHRVTGSGPAARAAVIRRGAVQPFTSVVSAGGAADDMAASSADVARWASLLYGGEVLRDSSLEAMLGEVERVAKFKPRTPYGLGVEAFTLPTWGLAYGHNGHLDGFRDLVRYLPTQGLSIAILANADAAPIGPLLTTLLSIAIPLGRPCDRCR